jgi:hypothetical protein
MPFLIYDVWLCYVLLNPMNESDLVSVSIKCIKRNPTM